MEWSRVERSGMGRLTVQRDGVKESITGPAGRRRCHSPEIASDQFKALTSLYAYAWKICSQVYITVALNLFRPSVRRNSSIGFGIRDVKMKME